MGSSVSLHEIRGLSCPHVAELKEDIMGALVVAVLGLILENFTHQ